MKKILIADDHSVVRKGLQQIIANEFTDVEFGEAINGEDVFKKFREKEWDLLILDINMPGRNGLDILKQLKSERTDSIILVLSMHPEEQIAVRALRLGAAGYLTKDTADEELVRAVTKLFNGKKYITPSVAEQLVLQIDEHTDKAPHELLSNREFQTMLLLASGKTVSQIARELSLSIPTISTYRARILEKTGMKTTAEITSYAIRNNLV